MIKTHKLDFLHPQENYSIKIDAGSKGVDISPTFIGVFFEDINYGADGGLYAELIQNRSFEFGVFKDRFSKFDDYFYAWEKFIKGNGKFKIARENEEPIHQNNPHYLEVTIEETGEGVGISNTGFGGIALNESQSYNLSVFLKNNDYKGNIHVLLESKTGELYAEHTISNHELSHTWHKYEAVLISKRSDANAKLSIRFDNEGTLSLDMVSLFPGNTWANRKNGLREDLVQILKDLQPKFMRFPGGCIVEGKYLANAYNWKDTIGPVEHRKTNWNRWEEWQDAPYNQTYGLGFYEYFQLSEDIGAAPLPIINCGMSCQFQGKEVADNIEPFVQDALDLIEYANGDETTEWGAKRIADGHTEPFNLVYLGIGNEQWIDYDTPNQDKYFETYEVFRNRIKEKYPDIQLITTSGPFPNGKEFDIAWDIITEKTKEYIGQGKVYAELVDEHYYMSPDWFLDNDSRYDNYPRYEDGISSKVFAGEYACHTNGGPSKQGENNLYSALCEAAFMTGLERNSDVVGMTAYAPLFAKTTNIQWQPDLIWFDNTRVYGSVSYYVQKMFGNNMGTYTLKTDIASLSALPQHKRLPIYSIASKDEKTGDIIIKMVNIDEKSHAVNIQLQNAEYINSKACVTSLTSENKMDKNTLEEPRKVIEQVSVFEDAAPEFSYEMPAQSFVILRLKTN
ncbi:MAG: alpha-L-arabinofuranosidase [Clostridia bacterium]|jgi:alpha-N-arabinofuranosidase|nr:alpha-L-arabinofuranosidase [Clostridia bacterium]